MPCEREKPQRIFFTWLTLPRRPVRVAALGNSPAGTVEPQRESRFGCLVSDRHHELPQHPHVASDRGRKHDGLKRRLLKLESAATYSSEHPLLQRTPAHIAKGIRNG